MRFATWPLCGIIIIVSQQYAVFAQILKLQPENLRLNHKAYTYYAVQFKHTTDKDDSIKWEEQSLSGLPVYELHRRALSLVDGLDGYDLVGQIGDLEGHYLYSVDRRVKPALLPPPESDSTNSPFTRFWLWISGHSGSKILSKQDNDDDIDVAVLHKRALEQRSVDDIHWVSHQQPRQIRRKRLDTRRNQSTGQIAVPLTFDQLTDKLEMRDPELKNQWHLYNREFAGADINITGVWAMNITGRGVITAVIDDGLDIYHEDLKDAFYLNSSWDFNNHEKTPLNRLPDDVHGTRCAGEIAAASNSYCGVGIAYDSKVSGLRILSGQLTKVEEAMSLNYGFQENHLYSCSWGPEDDGTHIEGPSELVLNAFRKGIEEGRGGLGTIYVFATGNGGYYGDNCNYDGYTNSVYTISIGALDRRHNHPPYSEQCSAHLAVTYSSSSSGSPGIKTTDIRPRNCTANHGGTSAAAPLATGILALVLSVRPDLTWRDVQYLIVETAIPVTLEDPSWQKTASGRLYSHKFAYGRLDAYQLVTRAMNWTKVRRQVTYRSPVRNESRAIPNDAAGLTSTITIKQSDIESAMLSRLEHVTITVDIRHSHRGDIDIQLISPNNIVSMIGPHRQYDGNSDIRKWTFMSVKHWGESPVGVWTLRVLDRFNPQHKGSLDSWELKLWGEAAQRTAPTPATKTAGDETKLPTGKPTPGSGGNTEWYSWISAKWWYLLIGLAASMIVGGIGWVAVSRLAGKNSSVPTSEALLGRPSDGNNGRSGTAAAQSKGRRWFTDWIPQWISGAIKPPNSKYSSLEVDLDELERAFGGENENENNKALTTPEASSLRSSPQIRREVYSIE